MSKSARIIGVGGYKPPKITNEEYIEIFGKKARIISEKIPHASRFSVINLATGEIKTTNTEMAFEAAKAALSMAGISENNIEMIIYSSATPDYLLPPCFTILQEKLGIAECMGFDIRSGCSGFGAAMISAQQYIQTGIAHRVLVIGSDLSSSRFSFLFENDKKDFPLKALYNLMLFGDGAGAVILEECATEDEGIFYSQLGSTRPFIPFGSIMSVGGSIDPYPTSSIDKEQWPLSQAGPQTEATIPEVLIEAIQKFIRQTQMSLSQFDHIILPVDSEKMLEKIVDQLPGLNLERIISISPEGGSLANAAVPLTLVKAKEEQRFKKGDKILIYAAENTRWQHGVIGLNWSL